MYLVFMFSIMSFLFSQNTYISIISQYGNGQKVTSQNLEVPRYENYYYLENLIDINYNYNNWSFNSQFEYSDPPIFGFDLNRNYNVYSRLFVNDYLI